MNQFKQIALQKIAANSGVLTTLVQKAFNLNEPEQKFYSIGSVGPGTTVMAPSNVVKPDGSVDIVINIRGIAGGDTKTATNLGLKAVIVTAEAGGMGSKENSAAYGHANFINSAVSKIISKIQSQHPDKQIKRGKLIVSGFSGGGSAIASIIHEENKIPNGIDSIILNDALHASKNDPRMKSIIDFAQKAKENPNKKFKLIHTAVEPGSYPSTTSVADYILSQLNIDRKKVTDWQGNGTKPASEAKEGGLTITQLYDQQMPYMLRDPKDGSTKPNVPGTAGWQHIDSLKWGNENMFKDLV